MYKCQDRYDHGVVLCFQTCTPHYCYELGDQVLEAIQYHTMRVYIFLIVLHGPVVFATTDVVWWLVLPPITRSTRLDGTMGFPLIPDRTNSLRAIGCTTSTGVVVLVLFKTLSVECLGRIGKCPFMPRQE
jgi:hypothetical protein